MATLSASPRLRSIPFPMRWQIKGIVFIWMPVKLAHLPLKHIMHYRLPPALILTGSSFPAPSQGEMEQRDLVRAADAGV